MSGPAPRRITTLQETYQAGWDDGEGERATEAHAQRLAFMMPAIRKQLTENNSGDGGLPPAA